MKLMRKKNLNKILHEIFSGAWNLSSSVCKTNSITNIVIWTMHIIMFALLKLDRVLDNFLPAGKYPPISAEMITAIIFLFWIFSITFSTLINHLYPCSYEPAVVLCIPALPFTFFIAGLSIFCLVFLFICCGFLGMILNIKKVSVSK